MKNRIWVFVVAFFAMTLFSINNMWAQNFPVHLQLIPRNILVNSVNGVIAKNVYTLTMRTDWNREITESWSIAVRLSNPLISDTITIPSNKISISFNKITGGITLGEVGVNNGTRYVLSDAKFTPLIISTDVDLKTGGSGKTYGIDFDIIVEGGDYLTVVQKTTKFPFGLTFLVTIGNQTAELSQNIDFQIDKIKGNNTIPEFGFEVNANASLNFTKPEDYTKQVESSDNSWVKVTSKNTGYIVKVKTNSSYFSGDKENIPVDVVSMKVDGPVSSASGTAIEAASLSNNEQVVFKGRATGTNQHLLDVRYFITKSEAEKLATKSSGQYTTTLTYTLSPP